MSNQLSSWRKCQTNYLPGEIPSQLVLNLVIYVVHLVTSRWTSHVIFRSSERKRCSCIFTLRSGLFKDLEGFNENISAWDTSKVLDMSSMFHGATAFNMPIGREGRKLCHESSKGFNMVLTYISHDCWVVRHLFNVKHIGSHDSCASFRWCSSVHPCSPLIFTHPGSRDPETPPSRSRSIDPNSTWSAGAVPEGRRPYS